MLTLDGVQIVQGDWSLRADLSVPQGARVAVLGPSGAGKSTLLSVIAGFVTPTRGRVLWDGVDITNTPPAERPVSIIFQDNNLFPHLSAADNVALGLRPDLRLTPDQRAKVLAVLDRVGLTGLGARKPAALSGGQAARVPLARALIRHRPLMLLDEPFGGLGPALKAEMLDLVAQLADETGATLLMVSHEPNDAKALAESVVLVAEGSAAAPVPTEEIFLTPPDALRAYLGQQGPTH